MKSSRRTHLLRSLLLSCLIPIAHGQQPIASPDPALVAKIKSAKAIFILNQGAGSMFLFNMPGGPNVCYNEFYASLKWAGHFQIVEDPAAADLILAVKCTEQAQDVEHVGLGLREQDYSFTNYPPFLRLTILDPGTKKPLYTLTQPAGRGSNIPKGQVALATSINLLTAKMMALVNLAPPLPAPAVLVGVVAPVPPQVLQAKNAFLRGNAQDELVAGLAAALKVWGRYTLVDIPAKADVVFEVRQDDPLRVEVYTASGQFQLWTVNDPNSTGYGLRGKKLMSAKVHNLMKAFETIGAQPKPQ